MSRLKFCYTKNRPYEVAVRNDQAITPTQMNKLTNQGKAVSMASLESSAFYDNIGDFEGMPLENQRGVDMNMLWEASQEAKEKINKFQQHQKKVNRHASVITQPVEA